MRLTLLPSGRPPITIVAEVAATDAERARGLMHRRHLPSGRGMWFVFPTDVKHPFWMKDTHVPLDLIFVGADRRVVDLIRNAVPLSERSLQPRVPYRYVLEVPAGTTVAAGIGVGTGITVATTVAGPGMAPPATQVPASDRQDWAH
ncbi:MAG: DUF192 domain-containing protein [Deltaproteobacteria bacterium]|nr:DUF192 domain-containing protein [Deltaproteobacteria bacterium]